jgi:flagellar FliL protein
MDAEEVTASSALLDESDLYKKEPSKKMVSKTEEQQQPKKKKTKLWIILGVAFIAIAACIYLYFSVGVKNSAAQVPAKDMKTVTFADITVNLADTNSSRYLKTTITLEYSSKDLDKEITASKYKVKDGILKVLRNTSASNLDTPEETDVLKQQLLEEVNSRLTSGKVTGLYFEDFIVQ